MSELVQYIIINNSLKMDKGKTAAQAAHAAISVLEKVDKKTINDWKRNGMKKIVLRINTTEELLKLFEKTKKKYPCALITDAGKTQVLPGSKTCFACGPINESEGEQVFFELKLL